MNSLFVKINLFDYANDLNKLSAIIIGKVEYYSKLIINMIFTW
jgi:hypothetical protein